MSPESRVLSNHAALPALVVLRCKDCSDSALVYLRCLLPAIPTAVGNSNSTFPTVRQPQNPVKENLRLFAFIFLRLNFGAPGETQTPTLLIRSQTPYSLGYGRTSYGQRERI